MTASGLTKHQGLMPVGRRIAQRCFLTAVVADPGKARYEARATIIRSGAFVVMDEPESALSVTGQLKLMPS